MGRGGGGSGRIFALSRRRASSGSKTCRRASSGKRFCVGGRGWQEIALSGRAGSSGSKTCRRASAGRLFCVVGGGGGGRRLFRAGEREFGLEQLPQGKRRETVLRGDLRKGEAAGNCSEREKGMGARRLAAGRAPGDGSAWGKRGQGGRQDIVLIARRGRSGSKSCRRASAGRLFCAAVLGRESRKA